MSKNTAEKYISIVEDKQTKGKKTKLFVVVNYREKVPVGLIHWHGAWRKYCFFPYADTLFDLHCLRLIADKCESETKLQLKK